MRSLIFIPFSSTEGNLTLFLRVLSWRSNSDDHHEPDKIPDVVIYRKKDETDEDYDGYHPALFKLDKDLISDQTNLYIVADGMRDGHFVTNVNDFYAKNHEQFYLPIELIALRLKESGFTPEIANKIKALKLFICGDTWGSTRELAINFAKLLGPGYEKLKLHYYLAPVTIRMGDDDLKLFKKYWQELNTVNGITQYKNKGSASEQREEMTVREALAVSPSLPENEFVSFLLSHNHAMLKKADPVSSFEITEINDDHDNNAESSSEPIVNLPDDQEEDLERLHNDSKKGSTANVEDESKALVVRKDMAIVKVNDEKNKAIIPFNIFTTQPMRVGTVSQIEHNTKPGIKK